MGLGKHFALLAAAVLAGGASAQTPATFVPNELIVGYKSGTNDYNRAAQFAGARGKVVGWHPVLRAFRVKTSGNVGMRNLAASYAQDPNVAYVEPNYYVQAQSTPNDPFFGSQYALKITKTDAAWDYWQPTASVVVAIVDTGVSGDHADLADMMHPVGFDFVNNDDDADDDHGHGTHCAGIVAGERGNGIGVAGVAGHYSSTTGIKIMPIKVLGENGSGNSAATASGIIFAADNGAKVISLSLGGPGYSQTLANAANYAWNKGCVVVAAAGNDGVDTMFYPAAHENVLSVAATDNKDKITSFSNYGSWVDVAAPGASILSTVRGGGYEAWSGTSMACPLVAGELALLWSHAPQATNAELVAVVKSSVDSYAPYNGHTIETGRVNVLSALQKLGQVELKPDLSSIAFSTGTLLGSQNGSLTVRLAGPVKTGTVKVNLTSYGGLLSLPRSVTFRPGQSSLDVPFTSKTVIVALDAQVLAKQGQISKTASIHLLPFLLESFTLPETAVAGGFAEAVLTLDHPAPKGGITIRLRSDNRNLRVPSSVRIPQGSTSLTLNLAVNRRATEGDANISAYLGMTTTTRKVHITLP